MELPAEWVAVGFAACAGAIAFLGRAQSSGHKKCEERMEKQEAWIRDNLVALIQDNSNALAAVATQMRGIKREVRDLAPSDEQVKDESESDLHRTVRNGFERQVLETSVDGETTAIIRRVR